MKRLLKCGRSISIGKNIEWMSACLLRNIKIYISNKKSLTSYKKIWNLLYHSYTVNLRDEFNNSLGFIFIIYNL